MDRAHELKCLRTALKQFLAVDWDDVKTALVKYEAAKRNAFAVLQATAT